MGDLPGENDEVTNTFLVYHTGIIECVHEPGKWVHSNLPDSALASWGIGIQGRHGNMGTGLIDKDQILTAQMAGLFAPGDALGFLLFARSQGFFFASSSMPFWPDSAWLDSP